MIVKSLSSAPSDLVDNQSTDYCLPDHVVDVNSFKQFETRLDKFWRNQDVTFDWTAKITGTRDRSEFTLETVLESSI